MTDAIGMDAIGIQSAQAAQSGWTVPSVELERGLHNLARAGSFREPLGVGTLVTDQPTSGVEDPVAGGAEAAVALAGHHDGCP